MTIKHKLFADEKLKRSPFYERMEALNPREAWSAWNGYKHANYFYDGQYEYFCIRNMCGTYDITAMQKYIVTGDDAEAMLDRMITRDLTKLKEGRVTYVVWCTDAGRVIDDGTIFKTGPQEFMLTCGSPCVAWLKKSCFGYNDVHCEDASDNIAALAFQGPTSCETLKVMGLSGIETLKPFGIMNFPFGDTELMVSRTGFTGDLGYELWIDAKHGLELWDALYKAGENYGIQPFGEEALNMARLEAGFIMPYMEFNEALKTVHFEHDQTPAELDLGWLVDFKKPRFNGRAALLEEKKRGPKYTLCKLDIEGNKAAEESEIYSDKACTKKIGYVTSAMWSPVVKASIALAMIETEHMKGDLWAEIYYSKELRPYKKIAKCTRKTKPFYAPPHARATPPGRF
ncbi:MAG: aminomethyltransferase family protein [Emcibacteraceae bacterium]|nr:aminomethyltransferase family protein [Emcibacteraceae bacterium]